MTVNPPGLVYFQGADCCINIQRGSDDCGLFAIAFAESLCSGDAPSSLHYTLIKMSPP